MAHALEPGTDRNRIEDLIYEYARRVDAGDFAGVGVLFAHGTFRAGEGTFRGDEVADVLAAMVIVGADGTPGTKHVVTNVTVRVEGDTARVDSYFTVLQTASGPALQPIVAGRYEDSFERDGERWRFADRVVHTELVGDVSRHLKTNPFT